ncbi:MAG TPA: hypothetical protein DDZ22_10580 [Massilia sp.]|nr:hypothetical protein [Massilia sp.]
MSSLDAWQGPLPAPATLLGYVDQCNFERVSGWLIDFAAVDVEFEVCVFIDGKLMGTGRANQSRGDLSQNPGFRGTHHAFDIDLSHIKWGVGQHEIVVTAKCYYYELKQGRHTLNKTSSELVAPPTHLDVALVGQKEWLFLCHDSNGCLEQYMGLLRLTDAALDGYRSLYRTRQEYLRSKNIDYTLAVVPGKESLYAEFLPESVQKGTRQSVLSQFITAVSPELEKSVIDLLPILQKSKSHGQLCYKHDSHWNYLGAMKAVIAILNQVRKTCPTVENLDVDKFRLVYGLESGGDLSRKERLDYVGGSYIPSVTGSAIANPISETVIDLRYDSTAAEIFDHPYTGLSKTRPTRLYKKRQATKLPRAIVLRDSYADWMIPFLAESFEEVLFIWSRSLDQSVIESFAPEVLIEEVVDRFLITNRASAVTR